MTNWSSLFILCPTTESPLLPEIQSKNYALAMAEAIQSPTSEVE